MYCSSCGDLLPDDAAFCPTCGAAQHGQQPMPRQDSALPSVLIALLLVFFFPLGLILMWTSSNWNTTLKWAITGFIFPPLWLVLIWRVWWLPYALGALFSWLVFRGLAEHGISTTGAVVILAIIAIILLLTHPMPPKRAKPRDLVAELRQRVDARLDTCNALIADIEATIGLDLAPAGSPLRRRYTDALELRAEGARLRERAATLAELRAADQRIGRALNDLRSVRDGLTG